ncbi:Aste57867_12986 [Aphanomyces stellatus]|uniref:Aste57867_12986 protein n=1 Tax=Aphanomyces stellatus TaxID=120398 RepID=A0A485KX01_9STRA|nr:hypothetical protein As57867_012938 [Aphanomyces stellatus]VFT89832.1 Aste57867_12986 [Aphanomyces stellatus]
MKIPDLVKERIDTTLSTTMYLVKTTGPTNYVIQEQNSDKKHRVLIGSVQSCSCGDKEICCHILFVMLKILRVPPANAVVWQRSLIDSETNMVLTGGYSQATEKKTTAFLRRKVAVDAADAGAEALAGSKESERHELVEGEVCAICQEEMVEAQKNLTYCKRGCGNNFHIDCMKIFGESRKQSKENIICPLCRQDWGDSALTELKKEADVANRNPLVHSGASCKQCQTKPIRCQRYRCLQCKQVDLCERCFKSNAHAKHAFVVRKAHKGTWFPALRTIRSSMLSPDAITELEGRDLSTADYDMLLELDAAEKYPLQDYLMSHLVAKLISAADTKAWTPPRVDALTWCTLCQQSLRIPAPIRELPCEHTFHESCVLQHVMGQHYTCPNDACEHVLFPGLHHLADKGVKKAAIAPTATPPGSQIAKNIATPPSSSTLPAIGLFSVVSLMKKPDGTVQPLTPLITPKQPVSIDGPRKHKTPLRPLPRHPPHPSNNQLEYDLNSLLSMGQPPQATTATHPPISKKLPPKPNMRRPTPPGPDTASLTLFAKDSRPHLLPQLKPSMPEPLSPTSARLAQADAARQQSRMQSQERKRQQTMATHERKQLSREAMSGLLPQLTLGPVLTRPDDGCRDRVAQQTSEKAQKAKAGRELKHRLVKERRESNNMTTAEATGLTL